MKKGGQRQNRYDTDVELDFRQESNFFYLSGVEDPGYHILIITDTNEIFLIPPTIPTKDQLWKGQPKSNDALLMKYDVNHILEEKDLIKFIHRLRPSVVYTFDTVDTTNFNVPVDRNILRLAIYEARLIKNSWEITCLRYTCHVSSRAHMALMEAVGKQEYSNEENLESLFRWLCAKNGLKRQCYIPIIASGLNAAVLHYTDNDKQISSSKHTLVLVDAGGERKCYGSDITRTFPACGTYSKEASDIYSIVLEAQKTVLENLKPGVYWNDMSRIAIEILCKGLLRVGILKKGDLNALVQLGVYKAFYFHGLGHSIGIDCHDVGGDDIGILNRKGTSLDMRKSPLEENMVITVEPGLYFSDISINLWLEKFEQYFDLEKINQYRVIGGVRIEDTVLITKDGHENLTIVPKEINEIEHLMRS